VFPIVPEIATSPRAQLSSLVGTTDFATLARGAPGVGVGTGGSSSSTVRQPAASPKRRVRSRNGLAVRASRRLIDEVHLVGLRQPGPISTLPPDGDVVAGRSVRVAGAGGRSCEWASGRRGEWVPESRPSLAAGCPTNRALVRRCDPVRSETRRPVKTARNCPNGRPCAPCRSRL